MIGFPYRWFGRDRPAGGWDEVPAARPGAWGLPDERVDRPVRGPFRTANALWAALGGADEAAGPEARSLAIGLPAVEDGRSRLEAALGRPVSLEAFVRQWCVDLDLAARTPPGQAPVEGIGPATGEVLAGTGELPAGAPLAEGVPARPASGVAVGRVTTGEGDHVVVRLGVPGGASLRVPAPFAYYGPLVPAADLPAFPAALAEQLLASRGSADEGLARTLAALPASSTWRTQFWLAVLEHAAPADLARLVAADDDRIALLARAAHRTPVFGPLLAAAGEQGIRTVGPVDAAAWGIARPETLTPSRRAVAVALQARGLSEVWAVRLFRDARDPDTGLFDTAHPTVRELVVAPLRDALVAGAPEPDAVLCLLRGLEGAGGREAVGHVLDEMLAEGATAPLELGAMARRLPAAEAGWLGRVSAGSLAGSWLS